jgi:hypothetical protein
MMSTWYTRIGVVIATIIATAAVVVFTHMQTTLDQQKDSLVAEKS